MLITCLSGWVRSVNEWCSLKTAYGKQFTCAKKALCETAVSLLFLEETLKKIRSFQKEMSKFLTIWKTHS